MQVNLSKHELEILDKALVAYQREPGNKGLLIGMLEMVFINKDANPEQREARAAVTADKMTAECKQREIQCLGLRCKLNQALNQNSEHEVTNS